MPSHYSLHLLVCPALFFRRQTEDAVITSSHRHTSPHKTYRDSNFVMQPFRRRFHYALQLVCLSVRTPISLSSCPRCSRLILHLGLRRSSDYHVEQSVSSFAHYLETDAFPCCVYQFDIFPNRVPPGKVRTISIFLYLAAGYWLNVRNFVPICM